MGQAGSSPAAPGPGGALAWAWMDVMELAGRLAQQNAKELKEMLRLPGDQANQARTQLQALAQALDHILNPGSDADQRASGGLPMEEGGRERSTEEVRRKAWGMLAHAEV
jgi:hypothetical protein